MAKNFDDFLATIDQDEMQIIIDAIMVEYGMEVGGNGASVPLNELPYFLLKIVDARTIYYLRKYHEWLNS